MHDKIFRYVGDQWIEEYTFFLSDNRIYLNSAQYRLMSKIGHFEKYDKSKLFISEIVTSVSIITRAV
jgi:hypothetical protein